MEKPKISVIVPVYNTEKYLRDCLESLVSQTLKEMEIVVVNDGSTDSSRQIIDEYVQNYPDRFVIVDQTNQGQAVARNKALNLCKGEYIGFLDSDDTAKSEMFEKMYNGALETKADMVVCDYEYIAGSGVLLRSVKSFKDQKDMFIDCFVDPWNKVYRAEVLKDNDVRFPEGYFYEDTGWFIMSIPFVNSVAKINEPLIQHYKREGSSMTALDDRRVEHIFPVLQKVLDFYSDKGLYSDYERELEYFCSKILLCSSFRRISRVKDKAIRKGLVRKTFSFLRENFPKYKRNDYYHGRLLKFYISFLSERTGELVIFGYRVLNSLKEWKERGNLQCSI